MWWRKNNFPLHFEHFSNIVHLGTLALENTSISPLVCWHTRTPGRSVFVEPRRNRRTRDGTTVPWEASTHENIKTRFDSCFEQSSWNLINSRSQWKTDWPRAFGGFHFYWFMKSFSENSISYIQIITNTIICFGFKYNVSIPFSNFLSGFAAINMFNMFFNKLNAEKYLLFLFDKSKYLFSPIYYILY